MAALNRDEPRRFETSNFTAAVAATAIYQGGATCSVIASGLAAGGAFASASHRFAGFAATHADIGQRVTLQPKGRVILTVAGSSAASVNAVVYASDDNSFNVSGSGVAIGRIAWVEDNGKCVVDFDASDEAGDAQVGGMVSSAWVKVPSIFRLRLTGTGTVTIDSKDSLGNITSAVATYTVSGATDQIEFPYAGDNAVAIRATLTGTATAEVI